MTYIRTANEPQNGLFRDLGFVQPEPIAQLLTDEDGYSGYLSDERMELLDTAEVVVWMGAAYAFGTALSLPVALDGLAPQLAAAVDGDPATTVGQR